MKILLPVLLAIIVFSCKDQKENNSDSSHSNFLELKYANGFSALYEDGHVWLTVNRPFQNAEHALKYVLVKKGNNIPKHDIDTQVIFIPIERIVCTSTTHIPLLDYINESESLVGFPTTDYISSLKTRELVDAGKVLDLGKDHSLNIERLLVSDPDLVMTYSVNSDIGYLNKIKESGISVVVNSEYLESHPLGRAEWIKFAALFYEKEKIADSVFREIEKEYLKIQSLVSETSKKPTVLSGVLYGDSWFLPAGQNYAARLFSDAGLTYLWEEEIGTGFIPLSFESVFSKAANADLWIGVASFSSLAEIQKADKRYVWFDAYKHQHVFSYNARIGARGGNEYLELGYLRPDLILKDLVKISHPELVPEHDLFFFKQLE
jgi:iron complex transport system substrate-binding protein